MALAFGIVSGFLGLLFGWFLPDQPLKSIAIGILLGFLWVSTAILAVGGIL